MVQDGDDGSLRRLLSSLTDVPKGAEDQDKHWSASSSGSILYGLAAHWLATEKHSSRFPLSSIFTFRARREKGNIFPTLDILHTLRHNVVFDPKCSRELTPARAGCPRNVRDRCKEKDLFAMGSRAVEVPMKTTALVKLH